MSITTAILLSWCYILFYKQFQMLWVVIVDGPVQGSESTSVHLADQLRSDMAAIPYIETLNIDDVMREKGSHAEQDNLIKSCKQLGLSGTVLQCRAL